MQEKLLEQISKFIPLILEEKMLNLFTEARRLLSI